MTDDLVTEARKGGPCADLGEQCRAIEATSGCFCAAVADRIEQLERELSISRMAQVVMDNGAEELTAERDHAWKMVAEADTRLGQALGDAIQDKADNARLWEALEFYADLSRDGPWHLPAEDYGKIARAALNTGKEPSHE